MTGAEPPGQESFGHEPPLVSVLLPVFNTERWLGEAIESVLAQEHPALELIVIDDGSSDGSAEIARSYGDRLRLLRRQNGGPAAARNTGLESCAGSMIAMADADDVMMPGRIAAQIDYLDRNAACGAVVGRQELLIEPGAPIPKWLADSEFEARTGVVMDGFVFSSLLARRSTFERVGHFDEGMPVGSDSDWMLRMSEEGIELGVMAAPLMRRRISGENVTADDSAVESSLTQIFKRRIDRKRAREAG